MILAATMSALMAMPAAAHGVTVSGRVASNGSADIEVYLGSVATTARGYVGHSYGHRHGNLISATFASHGVHHSGDTAYYFARARHDGRLISHHSPRIGMMAFFEGRRGADKVAIVTDVFADGTIELVREKRNGRVKTFYMNLDYPNRHKLRGYVINDFMKMGRRGRMLSAQAFMGFALPPRAHGHHYPRSYVVTSSYGHGHHDGYAHGHRAPSYRRTADRARSGSGFGHRGDVARGGHPGHGGHSGHVGGRDRAHDHRDTRRGDRRDDRAEGCTPAHSNGRGNAYGRCKDNRRNDAARGGGRGGRDARDAREDAKEARKEAKQAEKEARKQDKRAEKAEKRAEKEREKAEKKQDKAEKKRDKAQEKSAKAREKRQRKNDKKGRSGNGRGRGRNQQDV
jgi:hypothetical protein